MSDNSTFLATELSKLIIEDLKITESLKYLWEAAKNNISEYADGSDDDGVHIYTSINVFLNGKFDSWFDKFLNESQKDILKSYFPENDKFKIELYSNDKRNIELSFSLKIQRFDSKNTSNLFVEINFSKFSEFKYTISAEFGDELSADEISKIITWYELKR
jgi:hypothetical protein